MSDLDATTTKEKIIGAVVRYGICILFGGFLCWFVLWVNDFSSVTDELTRLKLLADCTTSPGMILILLGCLIWVTQMGALESLAFGFSYLIKSLIPGARKDRDETYLEFVQRRAGRKKVKLAPFFIVGGIFMAVSIVFIIKFVQLDAVM